MNRLRNRLVSLPRRRKRLLQVSVDIVLVWLALWAAFIVRLGIEDMYNPLRVHGWLFLAAPVVAIPLFIRFGMYRAVMRYFGNDALIAIIKAVSLSSLILAVVVFWYSNHQTVVPRSIVFNYWWLSMVIIGGLRLAMRHFFHGDWFSGVPRVPFSSRDSGLVKVPSKVRVI
ncbi:MAG: polysaccharide biosynthesis protein, partial [Cytophagaceae bacterium]